MRTHIDLLGSPGIIEEFELVNTLLPCYMLCSMGYVCLYVCLIYLSYMCGLVKSVHRTRRWLRGCVRAYCSHAPCLTEVTNLDFAFLVDLQR